MKRKAVFPGSFDPITIGHESIIRRSSSLFDEMTIAIGVNANKKYMFGLEQRKDWIKKTFSDLSNIKVADYTGLTVDFCREIDASYIIRGIRTAADFDFEKNISQMNKKLNPNIETILFLANPEYSMISSSIIRDIIINKGIADQFLPDGVKIDY